MTTTKKDRAYFAKLAVFSGCESISAENRTVLSWMGGARSDFAKLVFSGPEALEIGFRYFDE